MPHDPQRDHREQSLPDRLWLLRFCNVHMGDVMGVMSELDMQLQTIRRVMEDDMGDEPQTPKEIAQHKVEMAVRDAWLATAELLNLRNDPIAREFFNPRIEGDIWSMKSRIDLLISELRATDTNSTNVTAFRR